MNVCYIHININYWLVESCVQKTTRPYQTFPLFPRLFLPTLSFSSWILKRKITEICYFFEWGAGGERKEVSSLIYNGKLIQEKCSLSRQLVAMFYPVVFGSEETVGPCQDFVILFLLSFFSHLVCAGNLSYSQSNRPQFHCPSFLSSSKADNDKEKRLGSKKKTWKLSNFVLFCFF